MSFPLSTGNIKNTSSSSHRLCVVSGCLQSRVRKRTRLLSHAAATCPPQMDTVSDRIDMCRLPPTSSVWGKRSGGGGKVERRQCGLV